MVTMSDIAAKAGVSRPTVSVVLNQRDAVGICAETRQRVLDAANALGYRRNELARAVGSGKNHMIGFLAISPQVEFVAQMMMGALDEAERHGYTLKILRVKPDSEDTQVADQCVGLRLAGVVAAHMCNEPALEYLHGELTRHDIPLALVDSSFPHPWGIRILSNDEMGISKAASHLISLGHKRIAFIGGLSSSGSAVVRETAFRDSMSAAGLPLPEHYVLSGGWKAGPTELALNDLLILPKDERPTAILCANDDMALVTMRSARRFGLSVPQDLSVIGYGNLPRTDLSDPPLTTVAQSFTEMGAMAVKILLNRNQECPAAGINAPEEHSLETGLVIRGSTAPCPS